MPNSGDNLRFEVLVNGAPKAIGGFEGFGGMLSMNVMWSRIDPEAFGDEDGSLLTREQCSEFAKHARLSMFAVKPASNEHFLWSFDELKVGDVVTLRVLPPGEYDQPLCLDVSGEHG